VNCYGSFICLGGDGDKMDFIIIEGNGLNRKIVIIK
jgi:hypothetical protein